MKVYRAMCDEEANLWITGRNAWLRRFKWFSPNIQWVRARVQDGRFNNSYAKPERYVRLLEFEYDTTYQGKEIQLDIRSNPKITFIKEIIWKSIESEDVSEMNY